MVATTRYALPNMHKPIPFTLKIITFLVICIFFSCSKKMLVADLDPSYYRIDEKRVDADAEITATIRPYKEKLEEKMNEVIGQLGMELRKSKPNSSMGNWFCDILLEEANVRSSAPVDFALQNYGGLRIPSIAAGPINTGKIYELMPFDNTLVIIEAKGDVIQRLLDRVADYGGWPLSKGLSFTISDGKAQDIVINNKAFDIDNTYRFALPDYIANGGDSCFFLLDEKREDLGIMIRDLVIENIREKGKKDEIMTASPEERIR